VRRTEKKRNGLFAIAAGREIGKRTYGKKENVSLSLSIDYRLRTQVVNN
jgi:hypothetical protein